MAKAVWRDRGLALLDPAECNDDWVREIIRREAIRQYGERP
jgi:hypothetical protein